MNEPNKKPYTTPRLRTIKLETKEVMANACKAGESDFAMKGLPLCGVASPCITLGS